MTTTATAGGLTKEKWISLILLKLEEEARALEQAVTAAHEAATHEESKAEDQHDTRGLEASYLAGAQAARHGEIKQLMTLFKFLNPKSFGPQDPIAVGAMVELQLGPRKTLCFLVARGGGVSVHYDGRILQVITPNAPLGDALLGKRQGEEVEVEAQNTTREYRILSVI